MASFSTGSRNAWILSLKVLLISTGVLSVAVALKLSVPAMAEFLLFQVPSIWSFILSCLRPPYLYILMNCIIISIVASSKLQNNKILDDGAQVPPDAVHVQAVPPESTKVAATAGYSVYDGVIPNGYDGDANPSLEVWEARIQNIEEKTNATKMIKGRDETLLVHSSTEIGSQRQESMDFSCFSNENEKPPVSARFGHRKSVKASPEGWRAGALGVAKAKRQDTLESTWKTITEGRSMPLTRHLKKSDTWNPMPVDENTPPRMKKSGTFNDRSTASTTRDNSSLSPSPVSGKLRKEPSLSQDELNRRVEAFIRKFNEEMRLQRQESFNQYQEMIHRGVH